MTPSTPFPDAVCRPSVTMLFASEYLSALLSRFCRMSLRYWWSEHTRNSRFATMTMRSDPMASTRSRTSSFAEKAAFRTGAPPCSIWSACAHRSTSALRSSTERVILRTRTASPVPGAMPSPGTRSRSRQGRRQVSCPARWLPGEIVPASPRWAGAASSRLS